MARREIPVGNADDVMRIAQRQRSPGGFYYVAGQYDTSNPFSDGFVGDLYEAFRVLRIPNRDQRILLSYANNESIARIAEALNIPKSTVQRALDSTVRKIFTWPPFGLYTAVYEQFGKDVRAVFDLFS